MECDTSQLLQEPWGGAGLLQGPPLDRIRRTPYSSPCTNTYLCGPIHGLKQAVDLLVLCLTPGHPLRRSR
jgi:hypothetical protein